MLLTEGPGVRGPNSSPCRPKNILNYSACACMPVCVCACVAIVLNSFDSQTRKFIAVSGQEQKKRDEVATGNYAKYNTCTIVKRELF